MFQNYAKRLRMLPPMKRVIPPTTRTAITILIVSTPEGRNAISAEGCGVGVI